MYNADEVVKRTVSFGKIELNKLNKPERRASYFKLDSDLSEVKCEFAFQKKMNEFDILN